MFFLSSYLALKSSLTMASMLQFRVECKKTKPGQAVYVVGSVPELGSWKVDQGALEALARNFIFPRPMSHGFPLFQLQIISNIYFCSFLQLL